MRELKLNEVEQVSGGICGIPIGGPINPAAFGSAAGAVATSTGIVGAAATGWYVGTCIYNTFDTQIGDFVDWVMK